MADIDKKTWGELLVIVGGFILAETIIRTFLDLASGKIESWVLPLFAIAIIIAGVELKNGVKKDFGVWLYNCFIALSIIGIVFLKSGILTNTVFLWAIFVISIISISAWIIDWIFLKRGGKFNFFNGLI